MTSAELLPAAGLKRKAVVYIRQSTQAQVQTNLESQRRDGRSLGRPIIGQLGYELDPGQKHDPAKSRLLADASTGATQ